MGITAPRAVRVGESTVLGALELSAREALTTAGDQARDRVRSNMRNPGGAGARLQRRVTRLSNGVAVQVKPAPGDFYLRFVESGTGLWGPHHKPITPRSAEGFLLGHTRRVVFSVRGQEPQHMFAKARASLTPTVERIVQQGHVRATARVGRLIG